LASPGGSSPTAVVLRTVARKNSGRPVSAPAGTSASAAGRLGFGAFGAGSSGSSRPLSAHVASTSLQQPQLEIPELWVGGSGQQKQAGSGPGSGGSRLQNTMMHRVLMQHQQELQDLLNAGQGGKGAEGGGKQQQQQRARSGGRQRSPPDGAADELQRWVSWHSGSLSSVLIPRTVCARCSCCIKRLLAVPGHMSAMLVPQDVLLL
jgi:hypothetical protein